MEHRCQASGVHGAPFGVEACPEYAELDFQLSGLVSSFVANRKIAA
jgi:hypothetical protein